MIFDKENEIGLDKKYEVSIVTGNGTKITCFDNDPHTGWCGVCDANATSGQPGHCGEANAASWGVRVPSSPASRAEATRVTATSKWGWCGDSCYYRLGNHPTPSYLQVANVNILGTEDCVSNNNL